MKTFDEVKETVKYYQSAYIERAQTVLKNNPDLMMEIEEKVREVYDISLKKDNKSKKSKKEKEVAIEEVK